MAEAADDAGDEAWKVKETPRLQNAAAPPYRVEEDRLFQASSLGLCLSDARRVSSCGRKGCMQGIMVIITYILGMREGRGRRKEA